MQKQQFIRKLTQERDKFELLINRAGFSRKLTMKGASGALSIKDITARIFVREQYMADRLSEIINGEMSLPCKTHNALSAFNAQYGYPDLGSALLSNHEINAWIDEKYRNIAMEDIVMQELQAFSQIHAALEKINDEMFLKHDLQERIAENTYKQYHKYTMDIRRWLGEIKSTRR